MSKEEFSHNTDRILIQLVGDKKNVEGDWPLVTFRGGLDRVSVTRRGSVTTIKIASRDAALWMEGAWKRRPVRPGNGRKSAKIEPHNG